MVAEVELVAVVDVVMDLELSADLDAQVDEVQDVEVKKRRRINLDWILIWMVI